VLALLIGVASGTYSSIFNASQLLVSWERGEIQRLFFWRRFRRPARPAASAAGD
jgi:preprotein translocase subunit SecF